MTSPPRFPSAPGSLAGTAAAGAAVLAGTRRGAAPTRSQGGAGASTLPPQQPDLPGRHRRAPRRVRADLGGDRGACSRSSRRRSAGTTPSSLAPPTGAATKSADNLAWLFYKDGIRELKLLKGFEETEVVAFLRSIQRARKGAPDEDDLVDDAVGGGLLAAAVQVRRPAAGWRGGDDVVDGTSRAALRPTPSEVQRGTQEAVEESRAAGVVSMADFDATLYFLDEREIDYLQTEIAREYEQDLRRTSPRHCSTSSSCRPTRRCATKSSSTCTR